MIHFYIPVMCLSMGVKTMGEVHQTNWKRGAFILFICFVYIVYQIVDIMNYFTEIEIGAEIREVESLESLELLWHSQQWVARNSNGNCGEIPRQTYFLHIDAANNQLILPVWGSKFPMISRLYLTGFDLETGLTNWKTVIKMEGPSDFRGNSNGIFVAGRGPEPPLASCSPDLHYCESAKISAYESQTGEEIWSKLQSNMNNAGIFCANDEIVSIKGSATRSNYTQEVSLNALTGNKIPFQDLYPNTLNSGVATDWDVIEAMGIEGFSSDFVKQGRYLRLLTRPDKTLWILDRTTSEIVGKAEFSGEPLTERSYYQFAVAAVNEYVVVILGDSQQVFVFRRLPFLPDS